MHQVEIVVPVHNEQHVLAQSVRRLHEFLADGFPFTWRIVIADNASTDGTLAVARVLSAQLPGVDVLHLDGKGRGNALHEAWSASQAEVVCYMDVDLSTDLRGLLPLVAPLLSGHSDLAIGTRLSHGSKVVRGAKRELISRSYNQILRTALRARFSDAQCGFKAARTAALRDLLPRVRDRGWFFDTELLVLAQRDGLRIHEVPVDWVDDPDSRVAIVPTAWEDLKGVARLAADSHVTRFIGVGVLSTVAYALLYVLLRAPLGPAAANALALALTAVGNTAANRRLTFGVRGREGLLRQHAQGAAVYVLALAITSGTLMLLHAIDGTPPRALEVGVLAVASAAATIARYLALRTWVFYAKGTGGHAGRHTPLLDAPAKSSGAAAPKPGPRVSSPANGARTAAPAAEAPRQ